MCNPRVAPKRRLNSKNEKPDFLLKESGRYKDFASYRGILGHYAGWHRGRDIWGELADVSVQINLHEAALGGGIEGVRGQVEVQVLCAHAGIFEAGYG